MTATLHPFEVTVEIAAEPADIYDAWVQPEQVSRWFVPGSAWRAPADEMTIEPVRGGRYDVALIDPAGRTYPGEFIRVLDAEPGERLAFSTESGKAVVTFDPTVGGTCVTFSGCCTHDMAREAPAGWELLLRRLAEQVAAEAAESELALTA